MYVFVMEYKHNNYFGDHTNTIVRFQEMANQSREFNLHQSNKNIVCECTKSWPAIQGFPEKTQPTFKKIS